MNAAASGRAGAVLYVTHFPAIEAAKLVVQAAISHVVFMRHEVSRAQRANVHARVRVRARARALGGAGACQLRVAAFPTPAHPHPPFSRAARRLCAR